MRETDKSRARRGNVAHLRSEPPHQDQTLCGVNADSARVRAVSVEAFEAAQHRQCRNCARMRKRAAEA